MPGARRNGVGSIGRRSWSLICVAVMAAALATSAPARANEPPGQVARSNPADPRYPSHVVTLVTGDRVRVVTGAHPTATVLDSAPGTTAYAIFPAGKALYVIPDRAMALIASGRVDQKLFDVTGLVEQGHDDASSPSVPVIVEYGGAGLARRADPPGARVSRSLPSVQGVAADVTKSDATRFWRATVGDGTTAAPTSPAAGAAQLWLDAQVHTDADANVEQIGTPAAWLRGFTGLGVKVAVLDSGIDATVPVGWPWTEHKKPFELYRTVATQRPQ